MHASSYVRSSISTRTIAVRNSSGNSFRAFSTSGPITSEENAFSGLVFPSIFLAQREQFVILVDLFPVQKLRLCFSLPVAVDKKMALDG